MVWFLGERPTTLMPTFYELLQEVNLSPKGVGDGCGEWLPIRSTSGSLAITHPESRLHTVDHPREILSEARPANSAPCTVPDTPTALEGGACSAEWVIISWLLRRR
jgi:hypothetical protein